MQIAKNIALNILSNLSGIIFTYNNPHKKYPRKTVNVNFNILYGVEITNSFGDDEITFDGINKPRNINIVKREIIANNLFFVKNVLDSLFDVEDIQLLL